MTFSQYIISTLQKRFLIGFQIVNYLCEDNFSITFEGEDSKILVLELLIKSDSRLKLTLRTGNYAADLIETMQNADEIRKQLFVKYWEKVKSKICCKINVLINGHNVTIEEFVSKENWGTFTLAFESFPFYDPDEDNRQEVVTEHVVDLWTMLLSLIPYTIIGEKEGSKYEERITKHERNPINRQLCLQLKGYSCSVCGMKMQDVYGDIGYKYIEVHHTNPVADMGEDHPVDIVNELEPLCPNCHAMIHRRKPPYSIKELKEIIEKQKLSLPFCSD